MGLRQRPSPSRAVRLGVMAAIASFAFATAALRSLVYHLASASRMFCAVPCYDLIMVRQPDLGRRLVERLSTWPRAMRSYATHLIALREVARHVVVRKQSLTLMAVLVEQRRLKTAAATRRKGSGSV